MATDLTSVLKDANSFQKGLNAFDNSDFSKQCPDTKLIYKDIPNPDVDDDADLEPTPDVANLSTSIVVKDYCTDEPVPGAQVIVDGLTYTTNAEGIIYIGKRPGGTTLAVVITAAGYTGSADDTLNNDSITIPVTEEGSSSGGTANVIG